MSGRQTGGARRTWLFDIHDVDNIGPIRDALVHYDTYFEDDEPTESTLAIVLDRVLEDLPPELADAVRLVYLRGQTYRGAGRILGVDHKTVKARADRGVAAMKTRLVDSVWIAEMLRGYIPRDEIIRDPESPSNTRVHDIIHSMKDPADEQE